MCSNVFYWSDISCNCHRNITQHQRTKSAQLLLHSCSTRSRTRTHVPHCQVICLLHIKLDPSINSVRLSSTLYPVCLVHLCNFAERLAPPTRPAWTDATPIRSASRYQTVTAARPPEGPAATNNSRVLLRRFGVRVSVAQVRVSGVFAFCPTAASQQAAHSKHTAEANTTTTKTTPHICTRNAPALPRKHAHAQRFNRFAAEDAPYSSCTSREYYIFLIQLDSQVVVIFRRTHTPITYRGLSIMTMMLARSSLTHTNTHPNQFQLFARGSNMCTEICIFNKITI